MPRCRPAAPKSPTGLHHRLRQLPDRRGAEFAFVSEGKIYPISNQRFGGLARYAGQPITLTGELASGMITVSKIEKQ